jgi:hypothetical protein
MTKIRFISYALLFSLFLPSLGGGQLAAADSYDSEAKITAVLANPSDIPLLIDSLNQSIRAGDQSLKTITIRKLVRQYPFSPAGAILLQQVRNPTEAVTTNYGDEIWLVSLPLLRTFTLLAILFCSIKFQFKSARTMFCVALLAVTVTGEYLNYSRGLMKTVFVPFGGEHFALSARDSNSPAVEKLISGSELEVAEVDNRWVKILLPSGRSGWVNHQDGVIESEE